MTLYLAWSALKIKLFLKVDQQDTQDVLDPLYNKDKIYDMPIMSMKITMDENVDINHRERNII